MTIPAPVAERRTLHRRPWRWAFAVYAIVLTTGTHWPELALGPAIPASDKTLHYLAFGGLTFLLWRTRWLRRRLTLLVVSLLWVAADELSQAIPGLHRYITIADTVAGAMGVFTVTVGLWALRPIGDGPSQRRENLVWLAFDEAFARVGTWVVFTLHLLACTVPVVIQYFIGAPDAVAKSILIAGLVWLGTAIVILVGTTGLESNRLRARRACLQCAGSCPAPEPGAVRGWCPRCGAELRAGDWTLPRTRRGRALFINGVFAASLGAAFIAGLIVVSTATYGWAIGQLPDAPRVVRWLDHVPYTIVATIDMTALAAIFALGFSLARVRQIRWLDQGARCRSCGHDLSGTPITNRAGRCGECGAGFEAEPSDESGAS